MSNLVTILQGTGVSDQLQVIDLSLLIQFEGKVIALSDMVGSPQNPKHHPEGDVFQHTVCVVREAEHIANERGMTGVERFRYLLAMLLHDVAKPFTLDPVAITNHEHAERGAEMAPLFLQAMGVPDELSGIPVLEWVVEAIREHMILSGLKGNITPKAARRLKGRLNVLTVEELVHCVILADHNGRPPLPKGNSALALQLLELSESLPDAPEANPIVMGRDLIAQGVLPGIEMGALLKRAKAGEDAGEFTDLEGGLEFLGFGRVA